MADTFFKFHIWPSTAKTSPTGLRRKSNVCCKFSLLKTVVLGSGRGFLVPHSRSFFTRIPHPALFHHYPEAIMQDVDWPFRLIFCTRLVDSLLPLERLFGWWRFPEFPTDREKNPASRAQILANLASQVAVKSRILSKYFAFSRIPHRFLVKSRIPRIPFPDPFE